MSDKKDLGKEIVSVLEAQKQTGGRRKIYKEVSDQHKGEMLADDLARKIAGLRETIRRDRVDWGNLEQVQSRCLEYLQRCQEAPSFYCRSRTCLLTRWRLEPSTETWIL